LDLRITGICTYLSEKHKSFFLYIIFGVIDAESKGIIGNLSTSYSQEKFIWYCEELIHIPEKGIWDCDKLIGIHARGRSGGEFVKLKIN
jgi:hypothetical protein